MSAPLSAPGISRDSKERLRLWIRLLRASRTIEAELRERLKKEYDTTLPRFDVMAALFRFESGLKMSELSSELRVANGNVTGIIERLVADGAVVRAPVAGDKRATLVRLTKKGRQEFALMAAAHRGWISDIFQGLTLDACRRIGIAMDVIAGSPGLSRPADTDQ